MVYLRVLNPVLALMLNVLFQVSSFRLLRGMTLLRSLYTGFAFGLAGMLAIELSLLSIMKQPSDDLFFSMTVNLISYTALGYCYFHFINLGETARRIRILRELYDSTDGLSREEILERYNSREIIRRRIERLLNSGQIVRKNGRFYIGKPFLLFISRIMVLLKVILLRRERCDD
jgi:uncharacterized membrane protein